MRVEAPYVREDWFAELQEKEADQRLESELLIAEQRGEALLEKRQRLRLRRPVPLTFEI